MVAAGWSFTVDGVDVVALSSSGSEDRREIENCEIESEDERDLISVSSKARGRRGVHLGDCLEDSRRSDSCNEVKNTSVKPFSLLSLKPTNYSNNPKTNSSL
jgi:hypothetical protein